MNAHPEHDHDHDHSQPQLLQDLQTLTRHGGRRQMLRWLGALSAAGTLPLVGCGGGGSDSGTNLYNDNTSSTGGTTTTTSGSCSVVPEETAGPYPGDGSNTANGSVANALALSGIVRSDITTSVGSASGTAAGVPLKLVITLTNTNNSCASLDGYAIYLWHCTRDGKYSMYSSGVTGENYLRGVQQTDSNGQVTFETIFPGCYSGRMPHMHFEVYRDANTATSYTNKLKTSQLAFPVATCQTVYNNASGYSASVSNLAAISFNTDNVFSDGVTQQLVTISGDVTNGYEASITVSISV
ncbi:intradiol ring-cleavage dioxygenase [Aquabacterium soli]|uniref:intradiol ring-cleavage dioxygenase n=1 Tax=Aquabacterium soli TaxID=2493092 RepID=UPI0018F6DA37|nr:intradiol ring-cleavage dioxygenase [Aquabacterium soli]